MITGNKLVGEIASELIETGADQGAVHALIRWLIRN